MKPAIRDNFDGLPILADLGALLERHFLDAERRAGRAAVGPRPNGAIGPGSMTARPGSRRWLRVSTAGAPVVLSVIAVVLVAAVALTLIGHTRAPAGGRPPGPAGAFPRFPNLSSSEAKYVIGARRATIARDRACSPFASGLPLFAQGSPGSALRSILGVLRRPATAADDLPFLLQRSLLHDPDSAGREIYSDYIRLARTVAGVRFYIVPTGSASGLKPVPARCDAEQIATLKRELARTSKASRTRILAGQRQYLAWERYGELHPEGIAFAVMHPPHAKTSGGLNRGCCSTVADIENGVAGLGFMSANGSLFLDGVVPDGVATVTVRRTASPGYTATGTVVNNVWAVRLPVKNTASAFPLQYVWRSRQGAVVKTIG